MNLRFVYLVVFSCFLTLLGCSESEGEIRSPYSQSTSQSPTPLTPPTPTPTPTPSVSLSVSVLQIINGNPVFSGPQDAWHVILQYDYIPDPAYPCVVVETYYQWGTTFRRNIKIWDCIANPGPIVDDFYDYAWAEPVIEYSIKIYTASVNNGDWFNGFCMGDPSDYFGTVDPSWLYCPIDGAHPNGLRVASANVIAKSPIPQVVKFVRILGYAQVVVN